MNSKTSILIIVVVLTAAIHGDCAFARIASQDDPIKQLLADLDNEKFDVRQNASNALSQLELKAVPQLVQLVLTGSPEQVWRASKILMEIGAESDESSMAKIGRIFFLLGNRQPELITKAHLIRSNWKLYQLDRVAEKISDLGGQVTRIPFRPFDNRFLALRERPLRNLRDRRNPLIDSSDSTPFDPGQHPESESEIPKVQPLSNQQILDRTKAILTAPADEDIRALRTESELRADWIPTDEIASLSGTSFQIAIDEKWQGTDEDFQSLLDLSNIDFLGLSNLKLSRSMFQTLNRCQIRALSIEKCDVDSADLSDYASRHPSTYFNVRGRALLGVRGMVGIQADADGSAEGCALSDVISDGPAEKAGIRVSDIILKIDGANVAAFQDLLFTIAGKGPGESIEVTVERDGEEKVLSVTLGDAGNFAIR